MVAAHFSLLPGIEGVRHDGSNFHGGRARNFRPNTEIASPNLQKLKRFPFNFKLDLFNSARSLFGAALAGIDMGKSML